MSWRASVAGDRGSVSLEMVLAVRFLLIPATALLAQLPSWVGSTHAAQTAATEAARQVVLADTISEGVTAAVDMAAEVIANHGVDPGDLIDVEVATDPPGDLQRGQVVTVTVTLRGNPIHVPGLGSLDNPFDAVGSATERVDDYRGF